MTRIGTENALSHGRAACLSVGRVPGYIAKLLQDRKISSFFQEPAGRFGSNIRDSVSEVREGGAEAE